MLLEVERPFTLVVASAGSGARERGFPLQLSRVDGNGRNQLLSIIFTYSSFDSFHVHLIEGSK